MRPFRQLRFEDLPERPRAPHAWARATRREEVVPGSSFGPLRTVWHTFGQGPPLLLIHGLMTHGWSWRYVLEPLGARYTLLIPDLPGSGETQVPDGPFPPDRLADWIGEFAAHVGARGADTVGNSLGGYLCLRLALRDPGALGPLVDLHSPGIPLPRLRALRAALSVPGSHALLDWMIRRDPERWVHRNVHYYDESLKSREEARVWAAPLRSPEGRRAFAGLLRETLDPGEMAAFAARLAERRDRGEPFPVPLLLLYAATDPVVPPSVGEALRALIPGAAFERIGEASHFAHVDAVERFLPPVLAFFAQARRIP